MTWTRVGTGQPTWQGSPVEGTVSEIRTTEDVLDLLDDTPDDLIVLMHTAGATTLAPLFADIKGIVCTTGNKGSHVAILSREFGTPCLVAVELEDEALDGRVVRLDPGGAVLANDSGASRDT